MIKQGRESPTSQNLPQLNQGDRRKSSHFSNSEIKFISTPKIGRITVPRVKETIPSPERRNPTEEDQEVCHQKKREEIKAKNPIQKESPKRGVEATRYLTTKRKDPELVLQLPRPKNSEFNSLYQVSV